MTEQHEYRSDHAHGNRPAVHSHTGERGMGFGHTFAEHEELGDLGPPTFYTVSTPDLVYVGGPYCAICNGQCNGHEGTA